MCSQHMSFSLHLMPTLQSNHFLYGMGRFLLTLFKFYTTHEACSFFFLLFPSGFIMPQNSVIFNCGGKYFHVNNIFGPIFTSFAAVILITPLPWHSLWTLGQSTHFTKPFPIFPQMNCHMTEPRRLQKYRQLHSRLS